jgi:hypothetical protein
MFLTSALHISRLQGGRLVHIGGWPMLLGVAGGVRVLVFASAFLLFSFLSRFLAVTAVSFCSASPHLCLVVICAAADVHDVYELMRALSLIKVQNLLLALSMQCDI